MHKLKQIAPCIFQTIYENPSSDLSIPQKEKIIFRAKNALHHYFEHLSKEPRLHPSCKKKLNMGNMEKEKSDSPEPLINQETLCGSFSLHFVHSEAQNMNSDGNTQNGTIFII